VARSPNKTAKSADEWLIDGRDGEDTADSRETRGTNGDDFDPEAREGELRPGRHESIGAETAQWVPEPARELNGDRGAVPAKSPAKDEKVAAPPLKGDGQGTENRYLAKRLRELQTQLRVQEKEANAQLEQVTVELAKKHDSREQRLTETFERQRDELTKSFQRQKDDLTKSYEDRDTELQARIEELESELADVKKRSTQRKSAATKSTGRRKARKKDDGLNLNESTFEELRDLGLTVTQSARVIAYRDVRGGFASLEELDEIPGLSKETRSDLRKRLSLSS
jgi:DNA uptake protein ComE-like DNA-binding protein